MWTDCAVQPETLSKMLRKILFKSLLIYIYIFLIKKHYIKLANQKINHFPGMYQLARKNYLGRNLSKMQK